MKVGISFQSLTAAALAIAALFASTEAKAQVVDNLYVIQGGEMWTIEEDDGSYAQIGPNNGWAGATSLAGNGKGSGWVVQDSALWETGLASGTYQKLADDLPGPTELEYGSEYLWAWQSDRLWRINPDTGSATQLGVFTWQGVTSMAFLNLAATATANDLFVVQNSTLWTVSTIDGGATRLGPANGWPGETSMAAGSDGKLYIVQGGHLYAVSPTTGAWTDLGGGWTSTTSMEWLSGRLYIIDTSTLYEVNPTTGAWLRLGASGTWPGFTLMTYFRTVIT